MNKTIKSILVLSFVFLICDLAFAQENSVAPVLRPAIVQDSSHQPAGDGKVESFFQLSKVQNPSSQTANSSQKLSQVQSHTLSLLKALYKGLWRTLDNAGVPMLIGKDGDLSPQLSKGLLVMPRTDPTTASSQQVTKGSEMSIQKTPEGTEQAAKGAPQRIPQSELEGTIYESPATHDVHKPAP
jgi:hypothetical protein